MAISFIDYSYPKLPDAQVEGKSRKPSLMVPAILDLSALTQGAPGSEISFTLAPGSIAEDVRLISASFLEQSGFDTNAVDLQWRDGIVWKPFATLEHFNEATLETKWLLKTTKDAWKEYPRLKNLETVAQADLKEHWKNRGVEKRPNREVSAWSSFLASYSDAPVKVVQRSCVNLKALSSAETESAAVQGGTPLPRSLTTKDGRQRAAILLAATKGLTLRLRFVPRHGNTASFAFQAGARSLSSSARDPFGELRGADRRPLHSSLAASLGTVSKLPAL